MIIDFSVKNFRSFKSEQQLSFVASNYDRSLPDNLIDPELPGEFESMKLVKGLAIYGANASGKSNTLLALCFLCHLVENSADLNEGDPTGVEPFALDPSTPTEPTEFVLRFIIEGIRYHYALVLDTKRVLFESLSSFPKGREQSWYTRTWEEEKEGYGWEPIRPLEYKRAPHRVDSTRQNALYLSTAVKLADEQLKSIYLWFKEKWQMLRLGSHFPLGPNFTAKKMMEGATQKNALVRLLQAADIGVLSASVSEKEFKRDELPAEIPDNLAELITSRKHFQITFGHQGTEGKEYPLEWEDQSLGTQKLFSLSGPWLDILEKGYFAAVDEIESSMHPTMVVELLRLVFSTTYNRSQAQIIFTTQNPLLLDTTLIRRDQVWFTGKDKEGATHLYPLTDYKPRKGESLVRGYLSGRYGAVPFFPDGLLGGRVASHAK